MKCLVLLICLSVGFLSCEKINHHELENPSVKSLNEFLTNQNGFRIIKVVEEQSDVTPQFDKFLFHFNRNGTVSATSSNEERLGTYSVFSDDNRIELRMSFLDKGIINKLSDDWYFRSKDSINIRFEDNGDVIEFQKQQ